MVEQNTNTPSEEHDEKRPEAEVVHQTYRLQRRSVRRQPDRRRAGTGGAVTTARFVHSDASFQPRGPGTVDLIQPRAEGCVWSATNDPAQMGLFVAAEFVSLDMAHVVPVDLIQTPFFPSDKFDLNKLSPRLRQADRGGAAPRRGGSTAKACSDPGT